MCNSHKWEMLSWLKRISLSILTMAVLNLSPAWAKDPVYGWVTRVEGRQCFLDGRKEYELAQTIDPQSIEVGKFVLLLFDHEGEVIRVVPLPDSLAGPRRANRTNHQTNFS